MAYQKKYLFDPACCSQLMVVSWAAKSLVLSTEYSQRQAWTIGYNTIKCGTNLGQV